MKDVNRKSERTDPANGVALGPERKGGGAWTNAQNQTPRSRVVHYFLLAIFVSIFGCTVCVPKPQYAGIFGTLLIPV